MASYISSKTLAILALALALCVQGILGGAIECENLNKDSCAFAVSSSGKRCVLEKSVKRSGEESYTCRASEIEADKLKDWVETDQCIDACGVERTALGISSDSLLEAHFLKKLCSTQCYDSCPNIVDLYFNLAAGEGVFLPKLCETRGENVRRGLAEIKSSGYVAPGPGGVHPVKYVAAAPAPGHLVKYVAAAPEYVAAAPAPGHPVKYVAAAPAPGHPEKYVADAPEYVAAAPAPGHPVKYVADAPEYVAAAPAPGHPVKYVADAPEYVAAAPAPGHPVKYVAAAPAPGHPVKYIVAPIEAPAPY